MRLVCQQLNLGFKGQESVSIAPGVMTVLCLLLEVIFRGKHSILDIPLAVNGIRTNPPGGGLTFDRGGVSSHVLL